MNFNTDYINTDNIILEPVWDGIPGFCVDARDFYQISITAYNSFVKVNNFEFYMGSRATKELYKLINKYIQNNKTMVYEHKNQVYNNDTLFLQIKSPDVHGHVIINLKLENSNDNGNKNYAELFIETELGLLENFGKNILSLIKGNIRYKISLNKELDWNHKY